MKNSPKNAILLFYRGIYVIINTKLKHRRKWETKRARGGGERGKKERGQ